MYYDRQPKSKQKRYKQFLTAIGKLSKIFSESNNPYLSYRAHENIFCKAFEAENVGRDDSSADAKSGNIGIGLKTWTGTDNQKIAEFDTDGRNIRNLSGINLAKTVAGWRNGRIDTTIRMYGLEKLIYHVVKRYPHKMKIFESAFDKIDIDNITLLTQHSNYNNIANVYFTDNKHTYHYLKSKSTLYMFFDSMEKLDEFEVEILDDPYDFLITNLFSTSSSGLAMDYFFNENKNAYDKLCLKLYSGNGEKRFVPEKSGLNQWNAGGRERNADEMYIPYPSKERNNSVGFFPPRDTPFNLELPDGKIISAKVCQDDGKAIMSNPNRELGHWLLRDVFNLKEGTLVTYDMLERFGIDSVIFTKINNSSYKIDFCEIGTYEKYYENE